MSSTRTPARPNTALSWSRPSDRPVRFVELLGGQRPQLVAVVLTASPLCISHSRTRNWPANSHSCL